LTRRVIEDFRTLIEQSAHVFDHGRAPPTATGDSEVTYLNGIIFTFQKYVAGLQVPMYNVPLMQVVDSGQNLDDKLLDSCLRQTEPILIPQIRFQVTFVAILKQNTQYSLVLEVRFESADIRMPNILQNVALP